MLKDITLGQYFPGTSPLHSADPRTKVTLTAVFIVTLFLIKNPLGYLFTAIVLLLSVKLANIPVKTVLRGVKPILFVLAFTFVLNLFWTSGETVLFSWKFITVYKEGLENAVYMSLRIVLLIIGTSLFLTYTTSPIMLTDAIEDIFGFLKVFKLPVHEFAMIMTIALRFIPTLIEETDKIMDAQKARGAGISSGSLISRARALIPIIIPLFVSSFGRADELATAMECRCYRGGEGRTRMKVLKFASVDHILFAFAVLFVIAIVLLNIL